MICNKKGWHLLPIIIGENDMNGVNQDAIIADEIRLLIDEGFYQQGDKLPSELELCKKYNVQKMTIRSSLQILKDDTLRETCNNLNPQKILPAVVCCNNCLPSSDTSVLPFPQYLPVL